VPRFHTERVHALAKVNLDLRVLHRRDDGYHELRTIFQTIALHDTLTFSRTAGPFEMTVAGADVPADSTNIVWKAARLIWQAAGRAGEPHGVSVRIRKRIPVEAGLGGGSSDGAAALVMLNRLWNARLPPSVLFALAAALGSDVPFFLLGGTALGLGRGERLFPLPDLPPRHLVLARPREGVSTSQAYAWLREAERGSPSEQRLRVPWPPGVLAVANDFEPIVFRHVPSAERLRRLLTEAGADVALLSGSGSAVFGLFASETAATRAARRVPAGAGDVWVTRLRGRGRMGAPGV
jgi:4-diphosphocytidyl-2-C-methyl-D-erythritol kinase